MLTRLGLLLRNLRYFRLAGLAVAAGMAVAAAVLTGALLVGDSVRGSLRDMAVRRLGPVDHALVASQFFTQDLAQRLAAAPGFSAQFRQCIPGISVRGGAADSTGDTRTGGVQITALADWIQPASGECIINAELAEALSASASDNLLFSVPSAQETPGDATLARRGRSEVTSGLRATARAIARGDDMAALFSLAPSQRTPTNAWVNLRDLQGAVGQENRANLLLVSAREGHAGASSADALNTLLRGVAQLSDYGLELSRSPDNRDVVLGSRSTFVPPAVEVAAEASAAAQSIPLQRVLVYLVNHVVKIEDAAKPAALHYAIAAGVDPLPGGPPLAADEIAVNAWTAQQMNLKVGDRLRLDYYERQSNGDLREVRSDAPPLNLTFRVARILPMEGLGADPSLTPAYKGLTDAKSIADWDPPEGVGIDKKLVTPADEQYWDKYKAAPKLFVSLSTARRLWGNVYGQTTSLRVPAGRADAFIADLRGRIDPAALGLAFMPIRSQQLDAAAGGTEFSGLFVGFSFFIIAAAILLVAMLFRLNVEQRTRQWGLLSAVGFAPRRLLALAMAEGLLLAAIGAAVGVAASIGYTALVMLALRTWWIGAVGTTALRLHVAPLTLFIGFVASMAVAAGAVAWAAWRIRRAETGALLAGRWQTTPHTLRRGRLGLIIGLFLLAAGLVFILLGIAGRMPAQGAFMGGGACLLVGGLCIVANRIRIVRRDTDLRRWSIARLGLRNAGRNPGRSVVTISLIAFATFVLVTVASMRQQPPLDTHRRDSGTGGFQLLLRADLPLTGDLNTPKGRNLLGIRETDSPLWSRARFTSMRLWAGQDISCLNLTRPSSPTLLAVTASMIERGGFEFARTLQPVANPWTLLNTVAGPNDPVPVIADEETATYILKLGLGETLSITDQAGQVRPLRLVATLAHSIFQGELLVGEANFIRMFPAQGGFGMVLVESPSQDLSELRRLLNNELADFSVTLEPTSARLARYQQVANTYLSTFQTLGSLGLMLGTIGLAVILLRSLVERRAELALLAAIGFAPRSRLHLILAENLCLLAIGLAVGTVCALVGVLPAILASARAVNWLQLAATLVSILIIGIIVLWIAVYAGGRRISSQSLRAQ